MAETLYQTQKSKDSNVPKRRDNPTSRKSIPVDKGLDKVFRGNRYREEMTNEDNLLGKDGQ